MIQNINVGLTANNGLGDKLRNAMIIVNDNFIELQNNIDNISLSVTINDVVGLTTSLISLQSQIDSIESDIINISDVSGLTASLFNITNDITTIENDILNLQNTDITTQGSINTINSTISSINLSIIDINTTINDVITELNSLVTPSLQQVTDIDNTTTNGISADGGFTTQNTLTDMQLGTPYLGGSGKFSFNTSGDGIEFPSLQNTYINANVEEFINMFASDGYGNSNMFSLTPYSTSLYKSSNLGASSLTLNDNGVGVQTGLYGNAFLKTDLLSVDNTFQFPDKNGTIALLSDIPGVNTIIESAGFSISLNELTMNVEWIWSINNVEYTNLVENVFTIPLTNPGFIRIDLIVANTSGGFNRIEGGESDTVPVAPEAPIDTIQATFITVVDTGIDVVSAPTNGNYIIKDEKYIIDVDTLTINEEVTLFRNCNYKISDGISQISGFKFYSSILARYDLQIYVGKEYIIYNNGLSDINLVHNSGSVNLPMILNGGIDFSLAPGDSARFLLQRDNTLLHIDYKSQGGGGGSSFTTVTKSELDTLISTNGLIPGNTYEITGVDVSLYGGTTIYLQALTDNMLSSIGEGLFYTPKYNQTINGFNIWDILNTYSIGDKVHWGGMTWENVNGLVGTSLDIFTLDSEWSLIPFDDVNYNVSLDIIEYDYINDTIVLRKDINGNEVSCTYFSIQDEFGANPIKVFQWGNGINDYDYLGNSNNKVVNSYCENLNFIGDEFMNNTFTNLSYYYNNNFSLYSEITNNTLMNQSSIEGNSGQSDIYGNTLNGGYIALNVDCYFYENVINNTIRSSNNTYFSGNILNSGEYRSNNNSDISGNIGGSFRFNESVTLQNNNNSIIEGNTNSTMNNNTNCLINSCTLVGDIYGNRNGNFQVITGTGSVGGNIFSNTNTGISLLSLNDSYIIDNNFNNFASAEVIDFSLSGTLTNKTITKTIFNKGFSDNISGATFLFGDYNKTVFSRQDGAIRLSYFDNSDVLTVVSITA